MRHRTGTRSREATASTRRDPKRRDPKQQPDNETTADDILAPNSDTECEPLAKRRNEIGVIAGHVRAGGELFLLSTALRGPVTVNPWKRKLPVLDVSGTETATSKAKKRKRKGEGGKSIVGPVKDGKVDQYFPAQKNSQERVSGKGNEIAKGKVLKKYAAEADDPITSDGTPTQTKTIQKDRGSAVKASRAASPGPVRAVRRMIDFDQVPPSASIPSSSFPSLQIIRTDYEPGQRLSPLPDPIDNSTDDIAEKGRSAAGDNCLGLVDEPTPERKTVKEVYAISPTKHDLEAIRNLVGDPSQNEGKENTPSNPGLFDDPTPPQPQKGLNIQTTSPSKSPPIPSPNDFTPILPASITRCSHLTSSPTKSPLELLSPLGHLDTTRRRKSDRRRSSSASGLLPAHPIQRVPLQRSQTHNGVLLPAISTPPLNTQALFDRANESFNNAILPTIPSPITSSLLPPAPLHPKPKPRTGFTPFKELNRSPTPRDAVSFQLSSAGKGEGSPLTYSPVNQEALWDDIKGILNSTKWDLHEEVEKAVRGVGGAESAGGTNSQSQECAVGA